MHTVCDVIEINNWSEYTSFLKSNNLFSKKWIFRGQSDYTWGIKSSFDRIFEKTVATRRNARRRTMSNIYHLDRENAIISMFKSKSHLYSSLNPELLLNKKDTSNFCSVITGKYTDDKLYEILIKLEWLTIMQHYSSPTRLIDWTFSPYIAAFFAIEEFSDNSCIFALNTDILNEYNEYRMKLSNFKFDLLDGIDDKDDGSFILYNPLIKNQRISQQQGLFIVPTSITKSANEIFVNISTQLTKNIGHLIKFNKASLMESIEELQYMGITSETIYPGIDGLSKSLIFQMMKNPDDI